MSLSCLSPVGPQFAHSAEPEPEAVEFFEKKIRPVLAQHCYECHSAEALAKGKLKGGLLLDSREAMKRGGDSGEAMIAGKPQESLLVASLRHEGDYKMPPTGKLPPAVIADFETWIRTGAVDPREAVAAATAKPNIDWSTARDHWAFQPPRKTDPPAVKQTAWAQSDLDRFVLSKLEAQDLAPVAPADARTLLRRIHFDLTGLPPTPEEVAAFEVAVAKDRPAAVAALVDRLLASPHYGERWARHWLDVARYAQDQAHTFGNKPKLNAFQYRDWVIEALNNDLPYDQFVKLQIAGDLLPTPPEPLRGEVYSGETYAKAHARPDPKAFTQLAGLGFLGLGAEYYKNSDKARAEADELDDRIDTLTRGFLGLTVACARCHDHKFDPVPTRDYYSLAGIFSGSNLTEAPLASADIVKAYDQSQQAIRKHEEATKQWLVARIRARGREEAPQAAKYVVAAWRVSVLKQAKIAHTPDAIAKAAGLERAYLNRWTQYFAQKNAANVTPLLKEWYALAKPPAGLTDAAKLEPPAELEPLAAAFQTELLAALDDYYGAEETYQRELAAAAENAKQKVAKKPIAKPREALLKAILLDDQSPLAIAPAEFEKQYLAESDQAPLAAMRAELEALKKAAPPVYPAAPVIRGGGKALKVFVRGNPAVHGEWAPRGFLQIVIGEQPTVADAAVAQQKQYGRLELAESIAAPDNPLTARVIVNRIWQAHFGRGIVATPSNFGHSGDAPTHPELLDWLAVRFIENGWSLKWLHKEILLSSAYQLSSVDHAGNLEKDGDNRYYWRMSRRRLDVEAWRDSLLEVSGALDRSMGGLAYDLSDAGAKRRTVYAKVSRHELDGLLRLFDFPDANVTADRRTVTTVPQQQLFVLNSEFMVAQAKSFAARIEATAQDNGDRVRAAHRLAFGREPSDRELSLATEFLASEPAKNDKLTPLQQYAQALLASNEMLYVD